MRRPPIGASIAALLAILILCTLGGWQIQRLQWKTALLAQLDQAYNNPTPPLFTSTDITAAAAHDFAAARLRGKFIGNHYLLLGIRTWQGQAGYHLLAPFRLTDGGIVLINRGWVPLQFSPAMTAAPHGTQTIRGILHRPDHANPFVPANDPAQNRWYRWDLPAMAQTLGVSDLTPLVLYVQSDNASPNQPPPVAAALHWTLPNNHLSYAIFWFGMAGVLAIIFFVRFCAKPRRD